MSIPPEEGAGAPHPATGSPPVIGHVAYALMALGFFTGVAAIVGVIVAYASKRDARLDAPWLASHWDHIVLVFFYGLAGFVIAMLVTLLLGWLPAIGFIATAASWLVLAVWYGYQVIRGWGAYSQGRPVEASEQTWLIL